jgi:putative tryptophan/tyrosine transport system substrate-binding protein
MRRREFIAGLGSAAAWPVVARAQQTAMPVVGFLYSGSPEVGANVAAAFRSGLGETGYVEGRNVAMEYRWAHNDNNRLAELADDLVRRRVAIIATPGSAAASLAAKAATTTIPIVFQTALDPVQAGLVASLNRPGGNVTGFSSMNMELGAKRLGLLRELLPGAARFALLVNPASANAEAMIKDAQAGASTVGREIQVLTASTSLEIDTAFESLGQKGVEAMLVTPEVLFTNRRVHLATLAVRHAMPVIYPDRQYAEAGGLMTYGPNLPDQYRQAGIYAGRILKGEKPADLPVVQSTKFEFVINLNTAKALGLTIPETLLATAER